MKRFLPKTEQLLSKAGYTVGADLPEFNSSLAFTKGCISSIFCVVYNNTISNDNA